MLERIRLRNFQKHEALDVRFGPGITAIVGDSDTGKSAIIRALRWVAFNRPRGDSFVRDGESKASVKVRIGGKTIERRKSRTVNAYLLDGREMRSFGADVPESVADVVNLGEENFKGQHDAPFWFSLTPGELAKRLNAIVDLGLIDETTDRLAARLRKAKAERGFFAERVGEAEEKLAGLDHVLELDGDLAALEAAEERRDVLEARTSSLRILHHESLEGREQVERLAGAVLAGRNALSAGEESRRLGQRVERLERLTEDVREAEERVAAEVPDMGELEAVVRELEASEEVRDNVRRLAGGIERTIDRMEDAKVEAAAAYEKLKKETEGLCPVCGGELFPGV
jgi:exonuclease SbcC